MDLLLPKPTLFLPGWTDRYIYGILYRKLYLRESVCKLLKLNLDRQKKPTLFYSLLGGNELVEMAL